MIREFKIDDLNDVMQIWLNSNIKAHNFINENYWRDNFEMVKSLLPDATVFIYEENGEIQAFIGLTDNFIAGIFVTSDKQSKGIGKLLLSHVKEKYDFLSLKVYQKNVRAIKFYQRENFTIKKEQKDESTKETEYVMEFSTQ